MTFLSYQLVVDIVFKSTCIKMEDNTSASNLTLLEPFTGNLVTNLIASFAYVLSLGCSVFLIWFSWIEKSKSFSNFRPVTQPVLPEFFFKISGILLKSIWNFGQFCANFGRFRALFCQNFCIFTLPCCFYCIFMWQCFKNLKKV